MRLTLFCQHSDLITHLRAENEWLRMQMVHERQRAEIALDRLLNVKLPGIGPITVPTPQEQRAYDQLSGPGDPEFEQTGQLP